MRFTLKQLQAFVAAAQDSNVSSAARRLSLSQSAVSTALAELEQHFGRPLFDRIGKRLQLNETGKQLLPRAINLLTQAEELEQYARSGEATGHFRIGATLTIGNYLAATLISEYMRRHAQSRIQLKVANTSQIIDGMPNGAASLTVEASRGAVKLQTGKLANYAFAMIIGLALFVSIFLLGVMR